MPVEITSKNLLAVEGKDEINFFCQLLHHLDISDFDIREVGGKNQFRDKLPSLVKSPGFMDNVECFAIIRDSDDDNEAAFKSIISIIKKINKDPLIDLSLSQPRRVNKFTSENPRVGVYLLPGNSEDGILEDLCIKIVKDNEVMNCVDEYIPCVSSAHRYINKNELSKAKIQAYLAGMPEIVRELGVGAKKGYFDFDSAEIEELKDFLGNLVK